MRSLLILLFIRSLVFARRSGGSHGGGGSYGDGWHSGRSPQTHTNYGYHQHISQTHITSNQGQAHTYPASPGLSGNKQNPTYGQRNVHNEVHHHYHYNPPQQITYGSVSHPVYHERPPVYVYEYRDSGSRYDNLLTGLALYNLGRMSADNHHRNHEYVNRPGEVCKLGISKSNGEYEETRIKCNLMSSFIWEAERGNAVPKNTVTTTITNVTTISNATNSNNTSVTSVVTVQNKTVDALQVKGPSIKVNPGMNCYMIRISRDTSILKKKVDCGLLQTYATTSLHYNGIEQIVLHKIIFMLCLVFFLVENGAGFIRTL